MDECKPLMSGRRADRRIAPMMSTVGGSASDDNQYGEGLGDGGTSSGGGASGGGAGAGSLGGGFFNAFNPFERGGGTGGAATPRVTPLPPPPMSPGDRPLSPLIEGTLRAKFSEKSPSP